MSHRPLLSASFLLMSMTMTARGATVDGEGFIRDWLMLAPFSIAEDTGADEIERKQLDKEGELKPKAGDQVKIAGQEVAWKAVTAKEYDLDLNVALGKQNEDVLGYLVSYVVADKDLTGLSAAIGSNDQAKVWVNGKEIYKFAEGRTIDKDSDKVAGVTLNKGVNTIVFKVINGKNDWAAALRFLDQGGKPVTGLTVKTTP